MQPHLRKLKNSANSKPMFSRKYKEKKRKKRKGIKKLELKANFQKK